MRSIALFFLMSLLVFASEFPDTFNSAGDEVYESMQRYLKIKHLKIYQDKPELLESFCLDANTSLQKGFALDKAKEDPESKIDKQMIKSYARELRRLSDQNEVIMMQLEVDIKKLYQAGDMKSLAQIEEAGFVLDDEIRKSIAEHSKQQAVNEAIAKANLLQAKQTRAVEEVKKTTLKEAAATVEELPKSIVEPVSKAVVPEVLIPAETVVPVKIEEPEQAIKIPEKKPTELEYYQQTLVSLKEELYRLRENTEDVISDVNTSLSDQTKTACLNDITAINYWMIKVLENKKDACALSDAIRQMKSYDKSAAASCGRESMRYIEWHARIKPYVGSRLFQAEALCHK